MTPLFRAWWRFLTDLRPLLRFLAERFPKLSPTTVRIRSVLHWLTGNAIHATIILSAICIQQFTNVPKRWLILALMTSCLGAELGLRTLLDPRAWPVAWREAWRIRRRWPADWAVVAAKTTQVQAEVGTSSEPIASAVLRPIADHPKMSWLPKIDWPVVSWWVGPPPGRSLASLNELAVVLAANIARVSDVAVEYERENDSFGRLVVSFEDVLAATSSPTWAESPEPDNAIRTLPNSTTVVNEIESDPVAPPRLRLIDGDAR